ncbi:MAG: carboxypeptidase regulatory-like domain-containing protein [Planctomycetota bacterium]|jgi:peroxiredoxin/protocatechuate 3,4-dioxygenase beta subunit
MKPLNDTERSIAGLRVNTTEAADQRILGDAFAALEESLRQERAAIAPSVWRRILRSRMTKVAALVILITVAVVGVKFGTGRKEPPPPPRAPVVRQPEESELARVVAMFAARDVESLVSVLSEGEFKSKVLAAICLGEIGDERALPELERLYLLAEEKPPEGFKENPFTEPLERIKNRVRAEREEGRVEADTSKIAGEDVNKIGPAYPPEVAERVLDFMVVHKQTGEAVAGIVLDIQIVKEGRGEEGRQVTDEGGRCRIEIGEEEVDYVRIEADKEGFVPVQVAFRTDKPGAQIPESYTLALERGTSVGGYILNEEGEPIEGVSVYLLVADRAGSAIERVRLWDHEEKTDVSGFWRCPHVPAELDDISIRLAHPDYIDDEAYGVTKKPSLEELREMVGVMVMRKGLDVVGRVLDSSGQPLEGAKVGQGPDRYGTHYPTTKTAADGRFRFVQSRPGQMVLTAQAKGYAPDLKEFAAHADMEPVEFYLRPGRTIRGRVVDSNDRPISNVFVSADTWRGHRSIDWHSRTDSQGRFVWNDAPADEVFFNFMVDGREYVTISGLSLSASAERHIVEMHRPLQVRGKVADAVSKGPVRNFTLIPGGKSKSDGRVGWSRDRAVKFSNGYYEFEFDYGRDQYVILIEADGYQPSVSRAFDIGEEQIVFDFELERGEGLRGVVYLPDGEPAADVEVALCTSSVGVFIRQGEFFQKRYRQIIRTDTDGLFSFPPQSEPYLLVAVGDEGYAKVTDAEFELSGIIVLQPWGRVEGVVQIGNEPVADVEVWLSSEPPSEYDVLRVGHDYRAVTDADGRFVLERVVPGKARVVHERQRAARMSDSRVVPVEVVSGETVTVVIGGKGRVVVGRIVVPAAYDEPINWTYGYHCISPKPPELPTPPDFDRMSLEERQVWLENWKASEEGRRFEKLRLEKRQAYGVHIDHEGKFRVEDVPAGTYNLKVSVWKRPKDRQFGRIEVIGFLDHEFEIPEANETGISEPYDIGTLELAIKKRLKVGDEAPALEAETIDGRHFSLVEHRGKAVILNFWSSGNPESIQKLLEVEEVYRSFSQDGRLIMFAISPDDDLETAKKLARDHELKCVVCIADEDTGAETLSEYEVTRVALYADYERLTFPYIFVIGPDGKILASNPNLRQLETVLETALGL